MTEADIKEYMRRFEISREEAIFILAMEEGEIDGDAVAVDEQGNEVPQDWPLITD